MQHVDLTLFQSKQIKVKGIFEIMEKNCTWNKCYVIISVNFPLCDTGIVNVSKYLPVKGIN